MKVKLDQLDKERTKNWIRKQFLEANAFLGQPSLLTEITADTFDLYSANLPEILHPETTANTAVVVLSLLAPKLVDKHFAVAPSAAQTIMANLGQETPEIVQLAKIPLSERLPESQLSPVLPKKEVSLAEIRGATILNPPEIPAILISLLSLLPADALNKNPLLFFEEKDETGLSPIEKLRAIIEQEGISAQNLPSIRNLVGRVLARQLSLALSPQDLTETIKKYNLQGETRLLLEEIKTEMERLFQGGIPEARRKTTAPPKASFPPYFQFQRIPQAVNAWGQLLRRVSLESGVCNLGFDTEFYIYDRLSPVISKLTEPIFSRLGQTSFGIAIKKSKQKLGEVSAKAFWEIGKNGFKKAAAEGVKKASVWLGAKLSLTALATAIGTPIGGLVTFLATTVGPKLAQKARQLFNWPFSLGSSGRGQKVAAGVNGFIDSITREGLSPNESRLLAFALAGIFGLLFLLGLFKDATTTRAFLNFLIPSETRFVQPPTELPPGQIPLKSQDLKEIFKEAAKKYCVPLPIILAISQIEASGVWNYTQDQVDKFTQAGWWEKAGCKMEEKVPGDCTNGYCYDTCKVYPEFNCSQYSVVGPMQFEEGTWNGYAEQLRIDLGRQPHRCNLKDSVFAAAMKIKAGSGTAEGECDWREREDEEDIVRRTARAYCGSCGVEAECGDYPAPECEAANRPCGVNYCEAALILYNNYKNYNIYNDYY
jgi:hypothetical protein